MPQSIAHGVREPPLPDLASTDWLTIFLFILGSIGVGVSLRSSIKNSKDYFLAGRALPIWACTVAFICAGLGAQEVIGLGAAGAGFGFRAVLYFVLGGIPALLVAAYFAIPLYYGSGAVTLPGYLGLRFDAKTRTLSAVLLIATSLLSAGIALFMVARILQALRIFDRLFFAYGWPRENIFLFCILLAAVPVLVYVVVAGLRGTIVSQIIQFALLVAGFLPVVWIGLSNVGGWSGLRASLAALVPSEIANARPASVATVALLLGFFFGLSRWLTDFRVIQMAMAAKDVEGARRIPVLAAAFRLAVPFLIVLPGAIALAVPTPQNKTVVRNENGSILHEITIVPRAIAEGRGLVPALIDPATNKARLDDAGQPRLDYGMATPNMLMHFGTSGLLGLVIAGLLASVMSGVASGITAASTVFACDLYQPLFQKNDSDASQVRAARWATAAGVFLSVGAALAIAAWSGGSSRTVISACLTASILVFVLLQAPQLATFVMGIFTRRANRNGAFAGLLTGIGVAILHYGLTLPANAQPGIQGGWLAVVHRYDGSLAQVCFTFAFSFAANLLVAWVMSLFEHAQPEAGIKGLSYSGAKRRPEAKGKQAKIRKKGPEALAWVVLLAALVLGLVFF
jgi:SSS family solute:Na+ symporter